MAEFNLVPLLAYINPDVDYLTWTQVGMALKHEGYPVSVWEDWSRGGAKYHEGECAKKWQTFNEETGEIVTGATITQMAKAGGWKKEEKLDIFNMTFTDADLIPGVDVHDIEPEAFQIPDVENWDNVADVIDYLKALFRTDEHIGATLHTGYREEDGRFFPLQDENARTLKDILADLKRYPGNLELAFRGKPTNDAAGAWVIINPLDGEGRKNINVTDFRYALVESDDMPLDKQLAMIRKMNLPCAAIVYSGGKSVHAVVKVDADSAKEYRERVSKLYEICNKNGFKVDTQNKNPARLTRLPGYTRNGVPQFLIDTNTGAENWDKWLEYLNEVNDDLPPFESMAEILKDIPPYAPSCIDGLLRMGHKMILTGPSKAGKSFLLIQMAIAVASGRTWLKWQCRKGKVLYINLEIDPRSLAHRFEDIYENLEEEIPDIRELAADNISVWNLRGKVTPLQTLAPILKRRLSEQDYTLVIIDPIYKVLLGDENSAEDIARFGAYMDFLCENTGAAVVYCHHHSKGAQGMKKATDRGSGSGVFARDADAILDMTPIELSEDEKTADPDLAFSITTVLREFPDAGDFAVRFRYPIHEFDDALDPEKTEGSLEGNRIKGNNTQTANKNDRIDQFREKLERHLNAGDKVTQQDMADEVGVSVPTAKRYMKTLNEGKPTYTVGNGSGIIRWADTLA